MVRKKKNEKDLGYLKRTAEQRITQRQFIQPTHPVTGVDYITTKDKLAAVHDFYQDLYSDEPSHGRSTQLLLSNISSKISDVDYTAITAELTFDDIVDGVKRCS